MSSNNNNKDIRRETLNDPKRPIIPPAHASETPSPIDLEDLALPLRLRSNHVPMLQRQQDSSLASPINRTVASLPIRIKSGRDSSEMPPFTLAAAEELSPQRRFEESQLNTKRYIEQTMEQNHGILDEVDNQILALQNNVPSESYPSRPVSPSNREDEISNAQLSSAHNVKPRARLESVASRTSRTLTASRKHRRRLAEEFASAASATAASRMEAHKKNLRRQAQHHKKLKKAPMDDLVEEFKITLGDIGIDLTDADLYEKLIYEKSIQGGMTVEESTTESMDTTVDTIDTQETVVPPTPAVDPGFQTSARWRQRGPAGLSKARWASNRYRAKKNVKKTERWLAATPEERELIEKEAADSIVYIPDPIAVGPVPPRSLEPWLRSERQALLDVIQINNKKEATHETRLKRITEDYNRRMKDKKQKQGELCVAVGNGQSRSNSKLTQERIAPLRTQGAISGSLVKWISEGNLCSCREHQRYPKGDFPTSGGFPPGHTLDNCVYTDLEDACHCRDYLRDYNGELPDGHTSEGCGFLYRRR